MAHLQVSSGLGYLGSQVGFVLSEVVVALEILLVIVSYAQRAGVTESTKKPATLTISLAMRWIGVVL